MADNKFELPRGTPPTHHRPVGRRSRRIVVRSLLAVAATGGLTTGPGTTSAGGNGNALDEAVHHGSGVYRLRAHSYEPALRAIVGQSSVRRIPFDTMLAGRRGVTATCGTRCRTWTSGLQTSARWYAQGLAGSNESRWSGAPAADVVVAAWYLRRSESDHTAIASALKFISIRVRWPLTAGGGLAITNGGVSSRYNFWVDKDSTVDPISR
jgi:hypothetical protein